MRLTKNIGTAPQKGTHRRKPAGEAGLQKLYQKYIKRASERGNLFELTKSEFKVLTNGSCYYCNAPPSKIVTTTCANATDDGKKHAEYKYNGVDRIDNAKGYSLNNCRTACSQCNRAKSDFSAEEFKQWIDKVYNNWSQNV